MTEQEEINKWIKTQLQEKDFTELLDSTTDVLSRLVEMIEGNHECKATLSLAKSTVKCNNMLIEELHNVI